MLQDINEIGVRLFEQALHGWSGDDRRTLAALMQRLTAELAVIPQETSLPTRRRL